MKKDRRVFWGLFVVAAQTLNYYWEEFQALSSG